MNVYIGTLYKEVEYIQSSGTQYIRTGFVFTTNTKLVLDLQYTSVSPTQQRQSGTYFNTSPVMWEQYINGSGYWARSLDNNSNGGYWQSTNVTADTNRHTFELDNTRYIIYTNGTQIYNGTNTRSFTATNTAEMILLAGWSSDGNVIKNYSKAKLYGCKIYDNGTLVRDFIPCYRVSDNVIGLFDKVNNKFYANAGTGTFTKGNDVKVFQPELKNAYIGEYIEETYTIAKGGNTNIAKSGYKIKQITTSYTSSASSSDQYMSASVSLGDNVSSTNYELYIPYTYLSNNITSNSKFINLYCKYNGSTTTEYTTPALSPVTGPFVLEFTTTVDNIKCVCNGSTILDQSATTKWKQTAEYMFSLSNVYARYYLGGATSYYTGSNNVTVTVTYEKI